MLVAGRPENRALDPEHRVFDPRSRRAALHVFDDAEQIGVWRISQPDQTREVIPVEP